MVEVAPVPSQEAGSAACPPDSPFTGIFKLQIGGVPIGRFMEVSGLSVQINVEEIVEGGQNGFAHRRPGGFRWPNLVLKRGVTDNDALFDWLWATSGEGYYAKNSRIELRDGSVTLCDARRQAVRTWAFTKAFPVKWTGPKLAASSKELAVEELEICHHGLRASSKGG